MDISRNDNKIYTVELNILNGIITDNNSEGEYKNDNNSNNSEGEYIEDNNSEGEYKNDNNLKNKEQGTINNIQTKYSSIIPKINNKNSNKNNYKDAILPTLGIIIGATTLGPAGGAVIGTQLGLTSTTVLSGLIQTSSYLTGMGLGAITGSHMNKFNINPDNNCEWYNLYNTYDIISLIKIYNRIKKNKSLIQLITEQFSKEYSSLFKIKEEFIKLYLKRNTKKNFFNIDSRSNIEKINDAHLCIHYLLAFICQILINEPNHQLIEMILLIIEREVFKKIYHILFPCFLDNKELKNKNEKLKNKNEEYIKKDISEIEIIDIEDSLKKNINYQAYVETLRDMTKFHAPLDKLSCLKMVIKMVNYELYEYLGIKNLGADRLIPILIYIIIIADIPNLFSETQFIEEYTHDIYLSGEDGYTLASLCTVINAIIEL